MFPEPWGFDAPRFYSNAGTMAGLIVMPVVFTN